MFNISKLYWYLLALFVLATVVPILSVSRASAQSRFPLKCNHSANEGNSALDGGKHATSALTISESGRVDVTVTVDNRVALAGYCFRSAYFFRDSGGNVLIRHDLPQMCVDGTRVPLAGPSKRQQHFDFQLSEDVRKRVASVVIVHGPGSKDPGELLARTVSTGAGVFKLIFGR